MTDKSIKNVLIIGGGYAGVSLIDQLKKNKNINIILIDKSKYHFLQTHLHKYISGYYSKDDITFNHEEYCKQNNIKFICDEVTNINYDQNNIITKQKDLLSYDYLVIATGSISFFPKQIHNILEFTKDIKSIDNIDYYRSKFLNLIDSKPKNSNIVVVGGGVSGVQIACELAYTVKERGLSSENIKVSIVEGMNSLLPGMDSFLIKETQKRCKELEINVITKLFASKIYDNKIVLSNSEELSYNILIFVIGTEGNPISDTNIKENQRNQLIVDNYYRVSPYNNVFAIGDIVQALDTKTNSFQTPTAQSARMQAEITAKNLLRDINKVPLLINNVSNKGILIDLGGPSSAIGKLFNINITGKLALFTKKFIYFLHSKKLK